MLKLKFINKSDSDDVMIIQMVKGYLSNCNKAMRWFSSTDNNKVTVYEPSVPFNQFLGKVPDYNDVPTYVTRTYYWEKNSDITLQLTYSRYSDTVASRTGIEGLGCYGYIYYKGKMCIGSFGCSPKKPQPFHTGITGGAFGDTVFVYDDINELIIVVETPKFEITHVKPKEGSQFYNYEQMSGYPYQFEKNNSVSYDANGPKIGDKYVTANFDFFSEFVVGKIATVPLIGAIESDNSKYGYPSLYDLFKDYISKYPSGDDDPDFPSGDGDDDSDDIDPSPIFPTQATGFVSLYAPSASQLRSLASYMWSTEFFDLIVKVMRDPYDAIISIKNICCDIATSGTDNIILGNVDTGISCAVISQQYQQVDCGSINVSRYFGNFLDFNPYTSIKIYLPFIGYKELDVDEVMGATLHLYYNVDLLTGSCVAVLNVNKNIGGTALNSVLYQFDGMIGNEIPVTANDYSQVISAIIKGAATTAAAVGVTAATGGAGAGAGSALLGSAVAPSAKTLAVGGASMLNSAVDTITSKINVQHGGSLSGSMGVLATKQPYLIITRVIPKNPTNYAKLHGIPSNAYKKLSSLKGFTKMQDIQIQSTIGTVDETEEIKQLLLNGVVL